MTRREIAELDSETLINVARLNCDIQRTNPFKSEKSARARLRNRPIFAELARRGCTQRFDLFFPE